MDSEEQPCPEYPESGLSQGSATYRLWTKSSLLPVVYSARTKDGYYVFKWVKKLEEFSCVTSKLYGIGLSIYLIKSRGTTGIPAHVLSAFTQQGRIE